MRYIAVQGIIGNEREFGIKNSHWKYNAYYQLLWRNLLKWTSVIRPSFQIVKEEPFLWKI